LIDGSRFAVVSIAMLTFTRRSRYLLIRLGLGLIVVASFAAVVVIAYGLQAPAPLAVHDDYDPVVTLTSDSSDSTSVERARGQIASLMRADDAVDWTALTSDVALTGPELLPSTSFAAFQLEFIGDIYPAATDWRSSATHVTQGAPTDAMFPTAFAGSTLGGGGGGIGGGGGGGSIGSASPGSDSSGSLGTSNFALPTTLVALDRVNQDPRGPQSSNAGQDGSFHASDSNGAEKSNGRAGGPSVAKLAEGASGPTAVPEPSTLMLAAVGLISLIASRSRRRASC
jgi:hypothetical protein